MQVVKQLHYGPKQDGGGLTCVGSWRRGIASDTDPDEGDDGVRVPLRR